MTLRGEPVRFTHLQGHVTSFDDQAGWGMLRTASGVEVFFHCTQIADGSRAIPVGVAVEAVTGPIGFGAWEATGVRQVSV